MTLEQKWYCHSLAVGHGMKWDEATWQKVVSLTCCWWCDVMILPNRTWKYALSLTFCWSWDDEIRDSKAKNKAQHSQTVDHRTQMRFIRTAGLTVPHKLLKWDEMWWDSLWEKKGTMTHFLLVMGWNEIQCQAEKRGLSLTSCGLCNSETA